MPEPTFLLFESQPKTAEAPISLASSMQTLESVFLLVALRRYPPALSTCAAAIESSIKSSSVRTEGSDGLASVLDAARSASQDLAVFPADRLSAFRKARNRITHQGFSPRDDSESVGLLLEVGLPFLHQCYVHLFSFDLWNALPPEFEQQFRVGAEVYIRAKGAADLDRSYCLNGLGHLVMWSLRDRFSADWQIKALVRAEEVGTEFQLKYKERQRLEHVFSPSWIFDCPLCGEPESVVCQLDEGALRSGDVIPEQLACINCCLVVKKTELHLSEELLRNGASNEKQAILKEYGL